MEENRTEGEDIASGIGRSAGGDLGRCIGTILGRYGQEFDAAFCQPYAGRRQSAVHLSGIVKRAQGFSYLHGASQRFAGGHSPFAQSVAQRGWNRFRHVAPRVLSGTILGSDGEERKRKRAGILFCNGAVMAAANPGLTRDALEEDD
jgi:hypothetical protein